MAATKKTTKAGRVKPGKSIVVLDFGSQYTQLIARRIRELRYYAEIHPYNTPIEKIREFGPAGIILSGGPSSVYEKGIPKDGCDFIFIKFRQLFL